MRRITVLILLLLTISLIVSCKKTSNNPAAEKSATPSSSTVNHVPTEKLGISYSQAMNYLDNLFVMEKKGKTEFGEDRYSGKLSDSAAMLEIHGDKDNIMRACLIVYLSVLTTPIASEEDKQASIKNTAILARFLKNIVPEENPVSLFETILETGGKSSNTKTHIVVGNKYIEILYIQGNQESILSIEISRV
jgi:hypothetical protein